MKFISLTENHLFSKAYRSPQKALTRTVAVYVMKDRLEKKLKKENPLKESLNRVGISASKKVGGAVERNRAKRVVREAYRRTELECGIKKGYIIVIAAREKATVVKMQQVMKDLRYALARLDMLCSDNGTDGKNKKSEKIKKLEKTEKSGKNKTGEKPETEKENPTDSIRSIHSDAEGEKKRRCMSEAEEC